MTQSGKTDSDAEKVNLQRRDWILLPLLGLLTICVVVGCTEFIASRMLTESRPFVAACMGPVDPEAGARAIPNSVCWDKKFESQWVEYRFNSMGHRAGMEAEPKPAGTFRIVMTGSSFVMGHMVERDKTFAALLPEELSRRTGRRIEVYNEGMISVDPHVAALRMNDVLAAKPDMIFWVIVPFDVEAELPDVAALNPQQGTSGPLAKAWFRVKATFTSKSIPDALLDIYQRALIGTRETPAGEMLLHFLNESQSHYVKSYLAIGGEAGFLDAQASKKWQERLERFDDDAAEIQRRARAAGVPLVVTLVPNRAQAAMISEKEWPVGIDPYKLDNELRAIITSHGGIYIDILPDFRNIPNPEQGYFPVDSHPNAAGHAMISELMTKELTNGSVPELKAPAVTSEQGR